MKTTENRLVSLDEAKQLAESGNLVVFAGDEKLLKVLPKGNWIGGTINYFMTAEEGGVDSDDKLFATVFLDEYYTLNTIQYYNENQVAKIPENYSDNGVAIIIIPAFSSFHASFANEAGLTPELFGNPLIGWISGVYLENIGKEDPKVFNGLTGDMSKSDAVVLHMNLHEDYNAAIDIVNLYEANTKDKITFEEGGFDITDAIINGEKRNFADYITSINKDPFQPLITDLNGALINSSFQKVDEENKTVSLFAPVFEGFEYSIANPTLEYEKLFNQEIKDRNISAHFAMNCILNYLACDLKGKKVDEIVGPMTFGEVAYILLNQTMVYLTVKKN